MSETAFSLDLDRVGITAREREVLTLLGERLTNAEIGDRLFISVRTVESHVSSLLTKLGVANRRELTQFAGAARKRSFPIPSTSLVGREVELSEVGQLLTKNRLVTLTGVAGSGKTRVALEVGHRLASDFSDGAVFIDLVPVNEPQLVPGAAARALTATGEVRATIDDVVTYLADRELLAVIDNCEHVITGAIELIEAILARCARVKVLATTRQAFALSGEWVFPVPPLGLPDQGRPAKEAEAMRLLVERTEAVRPGLDLLGADLDHAIEICRLLDGLPLAIELAAVQMAHLTPADVASRLDDRFRLLVSRSAPTHNKTASLRAAVDWSYELLTPEERSLFNRLGVFAGSFSLEAAERVCAGSGLDRDDVSQLIASLVWRSWVLHLRDGESSRYRLLETIRVFALEQLDAEGFGDQVRAQLGEWCLEEVELAAPHIVRADAGQWLARIDNNIGNIRAALRWAVDNARVEEGSRLVTALWRYWHMRGNVAEGRRWTDAVLAAGGHDPAARARTLEAAGGLAYWDGDMGASREYYEEALEILRQSGDEADLANAFYNAAFPYGFSGQTEQGLAYAGHARDIYERLGDEAGVAKSLWAWGGIAHRAGRDDESRKAYERALPIYERLDDTFSLAWAHRMLGATLIRLGDLQQANAHIAEGMRLFDAAGDVSGMILCLRDFAQLALNSGQYGRALALAGALAAMEEESGMRLVEIFAEELVGMTEAREAVGAIRAGELFERGRNLSRAQAVRFAQSGTTRI
jgi:predicted ATPase/DNA-binding CsgD family transcriptional regulator